MTELRDRIASAAATAQNVPFVGPKQLRIADAILPFIREAQAEALDKFRSEYESLTIEAFKSLTDQPVDYQRGVADATTYVVGRLQGSVAAYRVGEER